LAWHGLQAVLWIALLAFVALVALPRVTPYEALIVRSGSMEPTIATGGIVIVDRSARSPTIGAIVSFREPDGSVVTHRVVGIKVGQFVTRGDANRSDDALPRPATSVYGTVMLSVPLAGYVIYTLQQPPAFLILLLGSGGLLVIGALRTIYREIGRLRKGPELTDAD
jgi:signal peptidase